MKNNLSKKIIDWYTTQNICLPWRSKSSCLYKTWISEIMLQQSQVATVIPYFNAWMKRFPSVKSLASAHVDSILKAWEGLGYYRRAHHIHQASKIIYKKHGSKIPNVYDDLIKMPGIGDYTAAAILSIGHNQPLLAIDGNFIRVFSRFFQIKGTKSSITKQIKKKLYEIDIDNFSSFNQAIMDLGRTVCTSKPKCISCPIAFDCLAHKNSLTDQYPQKSKRKIKPHYKVVVGIIYKNKKFIITKRPLVGLLGGLWELPGGKIEKGESPENALLREIKEELNINIDINNKLSLVYHEYSHFKVTISSYICTFKNGAVKLNGPTDWQWICINRTNTKSFPKATHKVFDLIRSINV